MIFRNEYWDNVKEVIGKIPNVEELKGKKILITGATGLIGSSVADILFFLNQESAYKIKIFLTGRSRDKVVKRFETFTEGKEYTFLFFDATKTTEFDVKVDYIIHGASNADPKMYSKEPVDTMLANLVGTNSLLKFAYEKQIRRLLYISSSEVYGKKNDFEPYAEMDFGYVDITTPRACYPCSKRAAETLCASYGMQYGINTVVVRPGHIYGPTILDTDSRASAQFTRNAIAGEDIVMKSAGLQKRSYCYSLDCASAIIAVLINGEKGEAYNISNSKSIVSIRDLAETIAHYAGTSVIFEIPSDEEIKGYNLMDNSSLDAKKLEGLGWSACFDLQRGVEQTILNMKNVI